MKGLIHMSITPDFKPGDQPPQGYVAWHAWAEVQYKAKLRQSLCPKCCKWVFPQEICCGPFRRSSQSEFDRMTRELEKQFPADAGEKKYRKELRAARRRGEID